MRKGVRTEVKRTGTLPSRQIVNGSTIPFVPFPIAGLPVRSV